MSEADDCEQYTNTFQEVAERVSGGSLPSALQEITERHHAELVSLIANLRAVGINEDLVRHSVREIVTSYEKELVGATIRLAKERR